MRLALFVLGLLLAPAVVRAQPASSSLRFGALRSEAHTPLALEREEVELSCERPESEDETMPCTVRARYTLSNPDAEARAVQLRFTVENGEGFVVGDRDTTGTAEAPVLSMRRFPFDSGSTRTIELSGASMIDEIRDPGPQPSDALTSRHPLLATSIRADDRGVIYSRAVTRHFVAAPDDVIVRARLPVGFRLVVEGDGVTPLPEESVDGWTVLRVHRPADETEPEIRLLVRHGETPVIRNGGPFIALGGVVLVPPDNALPNVLWARIGYEIGFVDWLMVSLAAETNFTSRFGLSAMIEAGSPSFGLPPSFSVGVGGVLRLLSERPEVTGGLRLGAGTTIYSVGFEALFDFFPVDGGFTITLLGRAGI